MLTNILVAAQEMDVDRAGAEVLCRRFIAAYAAALRGGKAHSFESASAWNSFMPGNSGLKSPRPR